MISRSEELLKFNPWWEGPYRPDFVQRLQYAQFLARNQSNRDIITFSKTARS